MPTQVLMPQFGESVVEGTITKWLKSVGDQVDEFDPLLEVNTDKVDTEVPSPISGTILDILVEEGTTVTAGTLLAWIGEPGEQLKTQPSAPVMEDIQTTEKADQPMAVDLSPTPAPLPTSIPGRDRDLGFISPVVAKIASESGIDLYQVQGSGLNGRITKQDVLAYIARQKEAPMPSGPVLKVEAETAIAARPTGEGERGGMLPLTPVRRAIAEHMVLSKRTSPHVSTIMEVDMSRVVAHRQANKESFSQDGVNLTFTAYFVAAAVAALKTYPRVNSSWSEEGIKLHREINIGMATSLGEAGLIVPVIKNADSLSLFGLAQVVNDLADRARGRKLQPEEVQGGTFTITNHGISGSLFATPIINQPQCGILGVGAIQKRVVVISDPDIGDTIAIRPMVYLGLTFDHRILDGAIADYFLGNVVENLQNWS